MNWVCGWKFVVILSGKDVIVPWTSVSLGSDLPRVGATRTKEPKTRGFYGGCGYRSDLIIVILDNRLADEILLVTNGQQF